MNGKLKIALSAALLSMVATPALAAEDLDKLIKDDNQWAAQRKDDANTGYSRLSQINKSNVKNLKLAWSFATGVNRGHEGAPLVVNNVMYVHTAFPNNVYALDLSDNQKIIWSYFPKQSPDVQSVLCCDNVNKGLGYGDGKIFLQQNNGELVALDAKTGAKIWNVKVTEPKTGSSNTNAPHILKTKSLPAVQAVNLVCVVI